MGSLVIHQRWMHQARQRTSGPSLHSICQWLKTTDILTDQEKWCGGPPLVSLGVDLNLELDC
jgi:hypothetical protein